MVFQGEEISIGVRGWTHGYDFYAPERSVLFHEYASKSKRRGRKGAVRAAYIVSHRIASHSIA